MEYSEDLFANRNYFEEYSHIKSHLIVGEESEKPVFVSLIIPTYKRPVLLKDALQSAINQKGFDDYEIVIVDNDPEQSFKTETQLLIETFNHPKIRYYKHDENIGMFANWNRGIELAHGKWITLLHDDDAYFSFYLWEMSKILKENLQIDGLKGSQYYWRDDHSKSILEIEKNFIYKKRNFRKIKKIDNYFVNSVGPTGIFYKKGNVLKLGGFSSDFYPSSDYLFSSKYLNAYNTYKTYEYLGVYRWSENEALKYETKAKMVEQDYVLRNQYRQLLKLKNPIWGSLNTYLTKRSIKDILLPDNKELGNNLKSILDQEVKFQIIVKVFYRIYRANLALRDHTFIFRILRKFKMFNNESIYRNIARY